MSKCLDERSDTRLDDWLTPQLLSICVANVRVRPSHSAMFVNRRVRKKEKELSTEV